MRTTLALVAAAISLGMLACGGSPTEPSTPTPTPTVTPTPTSGTLRTVTGTVLEFGDDGGSRPVPNLRLKVRASGPYDGAIGSAELPDVVTDTNGRYTVSGGGASLVFFSAAPGSGHKFLCDAYPVNMRMPLGGLPVVASTWSGNRPPPAMGIIGTSIYGTVTENINGVAQPVPDATVILDDVYYIP